MVKMQNTLALGAVFCFITLFTACDWFGAKKQDATTKRFFVVNVLDENYFNDAHIMPQEMAGREKIQSINVPYENVEKYASQNWNKNNDYIVVYCANYACTASGEAAKKLKELGFKNVWAYEGGTAEWQQLGYPVDGPAQEGYLKSVLPKPEHTDSEIPVISALELKQKMEEFAAQ